MGGSHNHVVPQGKTYVGEKKENTATANSSLFQGSYPLYWVIQDTLPNGNALEIVCTEMTIKII